MWMVAQGLYVLSLRDRAALQRAIRAWVVVGLLCIPVIVQLYVLMFVSEYQGTAASADYAALFSQFVPTLLFGSNTVPVWIGALFVLVLIAGLVWIGRREHAAGYLLRYWIFVPPILLYGLSFLSNFFNPRYVTTVIPALILALIAIATRTVPFRWRLCAASALTLVVGAVSWIEVYDYFYHDPPKAPDWPGLAAYLEERATPNDLVLFGQPDPAIEYYLTFDTDLYIIPFDWPDPEGEVKRLLETYDAVFLLSGERTSLAGQLLQANAQHIPGDTWPGVVQYRRWVVDPREIQHPLEITFGEVAKLRGYSVIGDTSLLLYWEALAQTPDIDYSILLHLDAASDKPPITLDHAIAGAIISTRTWTPGVVYRDPIALPPDLPPGEYSIRIGMYEYGAETSERLPIIGVEDQHDGRYPVGILTVSDYAN
jgi:hypothetical protein